MIKADDLDEDATARPRPWWFVPALLGVVLGGLLGLGGMSLPELAATTARQTSTSGPLSQPPATALPSARTTLSPVPTVRAAPRDAVLGLADLPPGFRLSDEQNSSFDRGFTYRDGYVDGWVASYFRPAQAGVAFLYAEVTAYASADDAQRALLRDVKFMTRGGTVELPLGQTIGDEAHAAVQPFGNPSESTYGVWFRVANTSNAIGVYGPLGTVDVSAAVELAKKQVARLRGSVFAPVLRPARVFVVASRIHTPASRYVLYDDATFVLEYAGVGDYRGTFTEANGVITFQWEGSSAAGLWRATGSLVGNTLTVEYNDVMIGNDFEDSDYVRTN